jgi:hypothetical protein
VKALQGEPNRYLNRVAVTHHSEATLTKMQCGFGAVELCVLEVENASIFLSTGGFSEPSIGVYDSAASHRYYCDPDRFWFSGHFDQGGAVVAPALKLRT